MNELSNVARARRTGLPACLTLSLLAAATLHAATAQAQENVFQLGAVVVPGSIDSVEAGETAMNAAEMERLHAQTVGEALVKTPGVAGSRNSRNENMIYVRGFDPRRVPLFLDGIPQYVPYDGYVDFDRFTVFDLSEIRIGKGAASLLYGPNALGGAINLVTLRPTREFEGNLRLGYASGAERTAAVNLGTNQGSWYMQLGASYLKANSYPLGRGFEDGKARPTDTGGYRENAAREDRKVSFKVGFTPNATDEYVLGYSSQRGEKGNPVYVGDNGDTRARTWKWPYWDKDSVYFLSRTALGADNEIKFRVFHDRYKNGLDMYTDASYQTVSSHSPYKDSAYGGGAEWINRSLANHEIHVAAQVKVDRHEEDPKSLRDVTYFAAVEDLITLSPDWRLRVGLSHARREARAAYVWPKDSASATDGVLALTRQLNETDEVFISAAHKTRFATLKDRFSARMGRSEPNPDLRPERAWHFELGYRGQPWAGAELQSSVFYSRMRDEIQSVSITPVGPTSCDTPTNCTQAQNVGKTEHKGIELGLSQSLGRTVNLGLSYTYLRRKDRSGTLPMTDTPTHRLYADLGWKPAEQWELIATFEAERGRIVSYGNAYRQLAGYGVVGLRGVWSARKDLDLSVGVSNLGDKNYELADGYPMPGRVWYGNVAYRF